jgi:hypothetical protein
MAGAATVVRGCIASALVCLASCVGDCGLFCADYSSEGPLSLTLDVEDARGNAVPLSSASLRQGSDTFGCVVDNSWPRAGCNETLAGAGTLTVQAEGQIITRDVDVDVFSQQACDYTQEVTLRLPGPGCPKPRGNAIEGRLLDAQGRDISGGSVTANLYGGVQRCRMTGAQFQCPSMSPYNATYKLEFQFGVSRLEREVFVLASECQAMSTDATVNLAEQCGDSPTGPAVAAIVAPADPATTEVRIESGDRSAPCARVSTEPNSELKYDCPALTATGGGTYRVTVDVGHAAQTKVFEVRDDGCNARTDVSFFYF